MLKTRAYKQKNVITLILFQRWVYVTSWNVCLPRRLNIANGWSWNTYILKITFDINSPRVPFIRPCILVSLQQKVRGRGQQLQGFLESSLRFTIDRVIWRHKDPVLLYVIWAQMQARRNIRPVDMRLSDFGCFRFRDQCVSVSLSAFSRTPGYKRKQIWRQLSSLGHAHASQLTLNVVRWRPAEALPARKTASGFSKLLYFISLLSGYIVQGSGKIMNYNKWVLLIV